MARHHQVSDDDITQALKAFGIRADSWKHISSGDVNTSYVIMLEGGLLYTLSFLNRKVRNPDQLYDILTYTAAERIPVPTPIPTRKGETFLTQGDNRIMLKSFIQGRCDRILPAEEMREAGSMLARIHELRPIEALEPVSFRGLEPAQLDEIAALTTADYSEWLRTSISTTDYMEDSDLPRGFAHGDFWSDNLVVTDTGLAVLDWDNAALDILVFDIAFALAGLLQDSSGILDRQRLDDFLNGYQSVRKLTDAEKETLPDALLRASALISGHRFYRHHILFPDPALHDPVKYGRYEETIYIGEAGRSLSFI